MVVVNITEKHVGVRGKTALLFPCVSAEGATDQTKSEAIVVTTEVVTVRDDARLSYTQGTLSIWLADRIPVRTCHISR